MKFNELTLQFHTCKLCLELAGDWRQKLSGIKPMGRLWPCRQWGQKWGFLNVYSSSTVVNQLWIPWGSCESAASDSGALEWGLTSHRVMTPPHSEKPISKGL